MARRVGRAALSHRVLVFVVVLGLSVGIAAVSAHQEDAEAGIGLGFAGTMVLCGLLWFVGWRRGAWRMSHGTLVLGPVLAGVIAVAAAGPNTIAAVVLAARGELVEVSAVPVSEADEDGNRSYVLVPLDGGDTIRGVLRTDREFDDTRVARVLVDPAGFVRPAFPDDLETVVWVLISLFGVGCLAVTTIGAGYPITPRGSDVEGEDSEAGAAR